MSMSSEQHQFACYYESLSLLLANTRGQKEQFLTIDDTNLVHRIFFVLRMNNGDGMTLFDSTIQITCTLTNVSKKLFTVQIEQIVTIEKLKPAVVVLLPLLKREALEDALYSCVELGATEIQLVRTKKVHRADCDEKQMHRLQSVIVAAAEQSKNFAFPILRAPIALSDALHVLSSNSMRLFFHAMGVDFGQLVDLLRINQSEAIVMMVGPEGDCTSDERDLLHAHSFKFFRLTPTVLRSCQAVAVGLGAVRSVVASF